MVLALLGAWDRPVELARVSAALLKLKPVIGECIDRAAKAWPLRLQAQELFASSDLVTICGDQLLRALLYSAPIWDVDLERFLIVPGRSVPDSRN